MAGTSQAWVVVGSNGLIGGAIARVLQGGRRVREGCSPSIRQYPSSDYVDANIALLNNLSSESVKLLFCAGRGGFSLAEASSLQQQEQFSDFCRRLASAGVGAETRLNGIVLISSLGVACSRAEGPYHRLVQSNEDVLRTVFPERALVLRLPSVYGYNHAKRRYSGLPGVLLSNLRQGRSTPLYALHSTRRNYLGADVIASALYSDSSSASTYGAAGFLNIQASCSFSIHDLSVHFLRVLRRRPLWRLLPIRTVDAESHDPLAVEGPRLVLQDPLSLWLRREWAHWSPPPAS